MENVWGFKTTINRRRRRRRKCFKMPIFTQGMRIIVYVDRNYLSEFLSMHAYMYIRIKLRTVRMEKSSAWEATKDLDTEFRFSINLVIPTWIHNLLKSIVIIFYTSKYLRWPTIIIILSYLITNLHYKLNYFLAVMEFWQL